MVRPVEDEKKLQYLDMADDNELRTDFLNAINKAKRKVFHRTNHKVFCDKIIDGPLLIQ